MTVNSRCALLFLVLFIRSVSSVQNTFWQRSAPTCTHPYSCMPTSECADRHSLEGTDEVLFSCQGKQMVCCPPAKPSSTPLPNLFTTTSSVAGCKQCQPNRPQSVPVGDTVKKESNVPRPQGQNSNPTGRPPEVGSGHVHHPSTGIRPVQPQPSDSRRPPQVQPQPSDSRRPPEVGSSHLHPPSTGMRPVQPQPSDSLQPPQIQPQPSDPRRPPEIGSGHLHPPVTGMRPIQLQPSDSRRPPQVQPQPSDSRRPAQVQPQPSDPRRPPEVGSGHVHPPATGIRPIQPQPSDSRRPPQVQPQPSDPRQPPQIQPPEGRRPPLPLTPPPFTQPSQPSLSSHRNFRLLPSESKCGVNNFSNRITEGEEVSLGEYPWMVLTGVRDKYGNYRWNCGGTLINEWYVLTAAHCTIVDNRFIEYVRLGEHSLLNETDCSRDVCLEPPEDISISEVIPHERWNTTTIKNDIALLRLSRNPLKLGKSNIYPICLPLDKDKLNITSSTKYEVAGWGKTDWNADEGSDVLRKASISGVNREECNICKDNKKHQYCPITDTQLCVQGWKSVDVCKGDSGGPLMVTRLNVYQIGITSFKGSEYCGAENIPSIFTKIDSYLPWILDNIRE